MHERSDQHQAKTVRGQVLALLGNNTSLLRLDDLVQDCSNSIANALVLLQSCTKMLSSINIEI